MKGSPHFQRFVKEAKRWSPHVRFKEIKYGFYRIYFKNFYIGECFKEMPPRGYDKLEEDMRFMDKNYYEEYEDTAKLTRQIKNFVEGYHDALDQFRTRMYMLRTDPEFYENSKKAYQNMYVK